MGKVLSKVLQMEGYHVTTFNNPVKALDYLKSAPADIVLSDIRMPELSGSDVLVRLREWGIPCEVIMMTAYGTIQGASECVKLGAFDYITKPFKTDEMLLTIGRAFEHKRLKDMNSALSEAYNGREAADDVATGSSGQEHLLLGGAPSMVRLREILERVAPSDSSVRIPGESGTRKELAARTLHRHRRRQ